MAKLGRGGSLAGIRDPLFPTCDGQAVLNPVPEDESWKIKLRFLDAYYRINRAHARLAGLTRRPKDARPNSRERRLLRAVEQALVAKDALEDCYASRGIVASPVYESGFVRDVKFQTPQSAKAYSIISSASVRLTFRLPVPLGRKP